MDYANGTSIEFTHPWGLTCKGRALCPDNKVRAFRGTSADTFFSIPARVSAKGTTVTGYVTVKTRQGYTTPADDDPLVVNFIPYKYRKNHALVNG